MLLYIVVLLILLLLYWWKNYGSAPCANFPPGPLGLPILGYLPVVTAKNIVLGLDQIHDAFGKVISVNLGPGKKTVVIGDYNILKEAFKEDKLNSRPVELMWMNQYFRYGNGRDSRGLLFSVKMWIYLTLGVILLFTYWWRKIASAPCDNFPPGPIGLPILGYLPIATEKNILVALDKIHDTYGKIVSVNLGPSKRTVVIGDYDILREAFKDGKLNSRPLELQWGNEYWRYGDGTDSRGLIFTVGEEWTEQRRFALRRLRDFGLGKSSMEDLIQEEIRELCNHLNTKLDQPISVYLIYNLSVVNALWTLISGSRFSLTDPKLIHLVNKMDELVKESGNATLLNVFPALRHVAPDFVGFTKAVKIMTSVVDVISDAIDQHKTNYEKSKDILKDDPRDFIDAYLNKIEDSPASSSFHSTLGFQNLRSVILDLFFAGMETTTTALTWSTLYMIKYPEIQRKVQEEIHNQVGLSRPVTMEDKVNLPFTEAVIHEVLRMTCIAPLGLPHAAQVDVQVGPYKIPKDTMIFPNLHRITRNPEVFPDPDQFKPERFLDAEGKFVKNEQNVVFSIGKRDCLGKSLALIEFFLFFASLMQNYQFKAVTENLDLEPHVQFTQSPKPFEVILSKFK